MKKQMYLLLMLLSMSMLATAQEPTSQPNLAVGDTVVVKRTTTHYMTGEKISRWVYEVEHTIRQVGSAFHPDGVLLRGIRSWLKNDDVEKTNATTPVVSQPIPTEAPSAEVVPELVQAEKEPVQKPALENPSTAYDVAPTTHIVESPAQTLPTKNGPTALRGRLVKEGTTNVIVGAVITLGNQNITTTSNLNGEFSLTYLEPGDEEIIIDADGFVGTIELYSLEEGQTTDMGNISLKEDIAKEAQEEVLLNLQEAELNDDEGKSQSQASASSASTDVFNSITSFAWSSARYRNRGYNQTYEQNYINGLSFNSAERGTFNFSAMGGLNDASRNRETVNPIEANNFTFGSLGKNTNYLMNASRFAQGWKVGVAGTNRNYKAAVRATYASGVLPSGWAFIGQLAFRFSPYTKQKGIIGEGIDYYSLGYFFGAEKLWDNGNKLSIVTFGAPTQRGQSAGVTQEAYDLTGSINYNPYWGYQNGKIRNSRIVKSFDPTAIVSFDWKVNKDNMLKFAVGYHYSWYSNSALQWYNAPNPAPDYIRNMPSFLWDGQIAYSSSDQLYHMYGDGADGKHFPYGNFIGANYNGYEMGEGHMGADGTQLGPTIDPKVYDNLVNLWKKRDNATTQIVWDDLYAANLGNNVLNPNGCAHYLVERRHNNIQEGAANVNYTYTGTQHLKITAGLEAKYSQGIHFKTVDDLLGGNQWIDMDPFADRDIKELATNLGMTQEEIEHVKMNNVASDYNTVKKQGDKFGYDYRINMSTERVWMQNEWSFNEFDFYYGIQATYSTMQRTTNMINGRAAYLVNLSMVNGTYEKDAVKYFGPSYQTIVNQIANKTLKANTTWMGTMHHFVDPAVKLGATYKINGRNRLRVNAIAQTVAPLARDAYISSRVHDRVVDNIYLHDNAKSLSDYYAASEKSVGADLTYEFNYPVIRGRITGFYSQFWGGTELNGYYDDEASTFVNQVITGINRRHMGIEAAAAVKLGTYFTLTGAVSVGDYRYISNGYAVTTAENGMALAQDVNGNAVFETRDSVYMNGLRVSAGPQVNTSLKLSFFHPKMWFADVTVSYYDWNYLDFAPSRRMKGLYTGVRDDGTAVNGSYRTAIEANPYGAIETEKVGDIEQIVYDGYGKPRLLYPYSIMDQQETMTATNVWNRFLVDVSVGKLIYLKKRQSVSINLSVSNITNNTHFKTGGYQQARLPRQTKQAVKDYQNSVISPNAWKYPSKYYYAWGTNFYLTVTYKF